MINFKPLETPCKTTLNSFNLEDGTYEISSNIPFNLVDDIDCVKLFKTDKSNDSFVFKAKTNDSGFRYRIEHYINYLGVNDVIDINDVGVKIVKTEGKDDK